MLTIVVESKTDHMASTSQPAAAPIAEASQSKGAEIRLAAASPAVSQTVEMTGISQTPISGPPNQVGWTGGCLDGLADVPEEVDQGHRGAADDRRPAGDEDADLSPARQVGVGAVGAEAP